MLHVLALAGSPRRGGNTDLLLEQALEGARQAGAQIENIVLNDLNIRPCQHCDGCLSTGICIIQDDMQAIHQKLRQADRLVLACPMFFLGLAGQAKMAIDRCQALWVEKYILGVRRQWARDGSRRRGLFLSVGGMRKPGLFDGARATVRAFFACCDVAYGEEVLLEGVDFYRAIMEHPSTLRQAFEAGARLAEQ